MKPTLILADDHQVLLSGLKNMLEGEFKIVATATDGPMLVAMAIKHKPELILADISMPGLNGIEALMQIRGAGVESRVVFLTMHRDATYAGRALEAGALGYVLKHEAPQKLVKALKAVGRGERYLSESIKGAVESLGTRESERTASLIGRLTQRQLEVLKLICEGHSAKELAAKLDISSRTAEFHKYRIMEILNVKSNAELVAYALRHGLA